MANTEQLLKEISGASSSQIRDYLKRNLRDFIQRAPTIVRPGPPSPPKIETEIQTFHLKPIVQREAADLRPAFVITTGAGGVPPDLTGVLTDVDVDCTDGNLVTTLTHWPDRPTPP